MKGGQCLPLREVLRTGPVEEESSRHWLEGERAGKMRAQVTQGGSKTRTRPTWRSPG